MGPKHRLRLARLWMGRWTRRLLVIGVFAGVFFSIATYSAVHHTAQPEFCNTCHIMEPYYESWVNSSHKNVACIECHYEPGVLETAEGKFKALSQLAKYVTRTQGTKPWAEVSDQSCMRSGCHSVRMLDGPIMFGRVKFDHRHHLLESRRGRRLRCVTCHSQIVQGEHVSVTESVCFTCHFMPDASGKPLESTSGCLVCHGPPTEPVLVGEKSFAHDDYVARGVDCRECHDPVIAGKGTVRKERCNSCHAEVGHIERIGETAFLHEMHVTDHKVECFDCHDQIDHGLLPLQSPHASRESEEGCGSCHKTSHDSAQLLYAGNGAVGVEADPSRMYETRVVCRACHTGRSGYTNGEGSSDVDLMAGAADHHGPLVAAAGAVDCIHCHGPSYKGILGEWQAAVGEQVDRLEPLLAALEARVAGQSDHPARQPLTEARTNVDLVIRDGSSGVHNPRYAMDALRASAARMDQATALLEPDAEATAGHGFPVLSGLACDDCHVAMGRPATVSMAERAFPHSNHLASGLSCQECHGIDEHGTTTVTPNACSACHHEENDERDVYECAECHKPQDDLLRGTLLGLEDPPAPKVDMDCYDCHGEPPDIMIPASALCAMCHDQTYPEKRTEIQESTRRRIAEAEAALQQAGGSLDAATRARLRASLDALLADRSAGIHNPELTDILLKEALEALSPDPPSPQ